MTRGGRPCFFSSLRQRRLAARLSRPPCPSPASTGPSRAAPRPHPAGRVRVWVAGPPQPVFLARDLDLDLVEVPLVAGTGQPPADLVREALAELERPLAHGLVADRDAAGGEQLLDHPQGEREAEVEPDRVTDDLGREAVAGVGRSGGWRHPGPIAGSPACAQPTTSQLDGAGRRAGPRRWRRGR